MILVTGGAGYIGSHTTKCLSQHGYSTLVVDNLSTGHRDFVKWGEFVHGDLGDLDALEACFKEYDITAVMHFAALTNVGESMEHPEKYIQNNVTNTYGLLDLMVKYGVKTCVFSSSCATYGDPVSLPLNEHHPQHPVSVYGDTKLRVEERLCELNDSDGLRSVSLRYFNAAGASPDGDIGESHDPETHLIPLVFHAILGKRPTLSVFGTDYPTTDGTCVRDYIHVSDIADAHLKALSYLENGGETIQVNLGNGKGYSVREVISLAERITDRVCPIEDAPRRDGDPPTLIADYSLATRVLGWTPQHPDLADMIESAWRWESR